MSIVAHVLLRAALALLVMSAAFAQPVPIPGDIESSLDQGVAFFQQGRYLDAITSFQKAVDFEPGDAMAHLYLGIAHMTQYSPGVGSAQSEAHGERAKAEFKRALEIAPANKTAVQYLASIALREAQAARDQEAKTRKLDESSDWYRKVLELDPQDKEAYMSLGMIAWMKLNPEVTNARMRIGMRQDEPGPLRDAALRQALSAKYSPVIEDGVSNLNKALQIDPVYQPAMTYMNFLIRARADLRTTPAEYQSDVAAAESWMQKTTSAMRARNVERVRLTEPPRVVSRVEPVYPPAAKQAGVAGIVRFTVIIGKDGRVQNLQLISGHPLLAAAAQEAVKKWLYKPTVINGAAVEVVTEQDVDFVLPAKGEKSRDRASAAATQK